RTGRALAVKQTQHSFAESVAHEEVRLGIAKLVMAVARIRRVRGLADKFMCLDEENVAFELRSRRGGGLGLTQLRPPCRRLDPGTGQLTNDNRERHRMKFLAHVL